MTWRLGSGRETCCQSRTHSTLHPPWNAPLLCPERLQRWQPVDLIPSGLSLALSSHDIGFPDQLLATAPLVLPLQVCNLVRSTPNDTTLSPWYLQVGLEVFSETLENPCDAADTVLNKMGHWADLVYCVSGSYVQSFLPIISSIQYTL